MIHPQMKNPIFVLFFFIIFLDYHYVSSQSPPPPPPPPLYPTNELFRPSLAIITGVFSIVFTLTLVLLVYAKCFHNDLRSETDGDGEGRRQDRLWEGLFSRSSRFSGLHKSAIESLPFFRFSALKGSKHGLECSVCLSKFEDVEILRLLPKCRHAFHIGCIDEWLEQHATCPLCRSRVSIEDDLSVLGNSNTSLRIMNSSETTEEETNLEIYIEREEEEEEEGSSSRFSSFRKILKMGKKEKQFLDEQGNEKPMHKWKHRIVVSDAVLKNRWSNVTPSDLTYLTSEMLNSLSSDRFSSIDRVQRGDVRGKEDRKMKEKETSRRTMSEIVTVSREGSLTVSKASTSRNNEERRRQIWLPIARRTAQWFVNREKSDTTRPSPNLNV